MGVASTALAAQVRERIEPEPTLTDSDRCSSRGRTFLRRRRWRLRSGRDLTPASTSFGKQSIRDAQAWIAGLRGATERAATGIKGLKVGFNRVFGYHYIEASATPTGR